MFLIEIAKQKGELKVFRSNLQGWLRCAKCYFQINKIIEEELMKVIILHLDYMTLEQYIKQKTNIHSRIDRISDFNLKSILELKLGNSYQQFLNIE